MFRSFSVPLNGQTWTAMSPVIVGIVNATPDSFFAKSRANSVADALAQAERHMLGGAHWLDVGGCSTRPGAETPPLEEEWARVAPILLAIAREFPTIPISIDTFRGEIAERALQSGASMINDVSAGSIDPTIWQVAATHHVPYVLTHYPTGVKTSGMEPPPLGPSETMEHMLTFFKEKMRQVKALGIEHILLDPGLGFGKALSSNYTALNGLPELLELNAPLYIGLSRKSMMWKLLGKSPETVLPATSALHLHALERGAQILRVHDAQEATDVITLWRELHQE
jgi:dihydropteroate synthase